MRHLECLRALLALLLLLAAAHGLPGAAAEGDGGSKRGLPPDAGCGDVLTVTIEVSPPAGTRAWFVEERPPPGVQVLEVSPEHNGHVGENGTVDWVSTSGEAALLTYDIRLPPDRTGEMGPFIGNYRFHDSMDERASVDGPATLELRCGSVLRVLPDTAACGSAFEVGVSVASPLGTSSWLLEETPPGGWSVSEVDPSDNGKYVTETETVKWLSTGGAGSFKTYHVTVPSSAPHGAAYVFTGEFRLHPGMTEREPVGGDRTVTVHCPATPDDDDNGTPDPDDPPDSVPSVDDLVPAEPGAPFVTRFLPTKVQCGEPFVVGLGVAPTHGTTSWVLVETPPMAAEVVWLDTANLGAIVPDRQEIKWISLTGDNIVQTYRLLVPSDTTDGAVLTFDGEARAHPSNEDRVPVIGHDQVEVSCPRATGGGGGGRTLPLPPPVVHLSGPGALPTPVTAIPTTAPEGAVWRAVTPEIFGFEGGAVSLSFPDESEGLKVAFVAGHDLEGITLTITRWATLPEQADALPEGFLPVVFLSIEVDGGPSRGHRIEMEVMTPVDTTPDHPYGVLLTEGAEDWDVSSPATFFDQESRQRMLASGPCCSLRVLGFDLFAPLIETDLREATTSLLRIDTDVTDNIGIATVQLFHDGRFLTNMTSPRGGHILDMDRMSAGEHLFEVVAVDVSGQVSQESLFWSHDPLRPAGDPKDGGGPTFFTWPWLLLLVLIGSLAAGASLYLKRHSDGQEGSDLRREPPTLSSVATEVAPPVGAVTARMFRVSGAKGSGANLILDDPVVPTLAFFLGERLDEVEVEVSKWPVDVPPIEVGRFPHEVDPIALLRIRLPPDIEGAYPVLVTVALAEEEVYNPSWIALLSWQQTEWQIADRFQFMLDPDGKYRGSALAEDRGWLLIGVRPPTPEEEEDLPGPTAPRPPDD